MFDSGMANAFRMEPEEFKNRYAYLFDEEPTLDNA